MASQDDSAEKALEAQQQQEMAQMEKDKQQQAQALGADKLSMIRRMQGNGSLFNGGNNSTLG
jgi:hypothetical protein